VVPVLFSESQSDINGALSDGLSREERSSIRVSRIQVFRPKIVTANSKAQSTLNLELP
jgi:hypothetical protein